MSVCLFCLPFWRFRVPPVVCGMSVSMSLSLSVCLARWLIGLATNDDDADHQLVVLIVAFNRFAQLANRRHSLSPKSQSQVSVPLPSPNLNPRLGPWGVLEVLDTIGTFNSYSLALCVRVCESKWQRSRA